MPGRDWVLVACAALLGVAFHWPAAQVPEGFPLDDAWIHLLYARSLSEGHGLAYNPGQLETGLSAPLWTVMLVPAVVLASDPFVSAWLVKVLGCSIAILTAWVLGRTLLVLGVGRWVAALVALALALDPHWMLGALSGMEVALAGLLLVALVHTLARGRYGLATAVMSLLPLARPETLVVVLVAWAWLLRTAWRSSSPRARAALVVVPWLGWALWSGYCTHVSGYPLPSTYYAKAAPSLAAWLHNARTLPAMWLGFGWFRGGLGLALLAWGLVCVLRPPTHARMVLGVGLAAYLAALFLTQPLKEPHTLYWMRYALPLLPWAIMLGAFGFDHAWRRVGAGARRHALLAIAALLVGGWAMTVPGVVEHYRRSCENVGELNIAVARWLRAHVAPGAWIATHDAGAIRYFSAHPVLDLAGLNDHRVAHGGLSGELARTRPRYFAAFPSWFPVLERDPRFSRVFTAHAEHYVISSAKQNELPVYRFDP